MEVDCTSCGHVNVVDEDHPAALMGEAYCRACHAVFLLPLTGDHSSEDAESLPDPQPLHGGTFGDSNPALPTGNDSQVAATQRPKKGRTFGDSKTKLPTGPDSQATAGYRQKIEVSKGQKSNAALQGGKDWAAGAWRQLRQAEAYVADEASSMARPRARLGLFLGVALVAVIGSGVVVGVVRSKRLHVEPEVQLPIHVVHAPDPIARDAFARGMRALLDDTYEGYIAASRAFDAAIARDPEFTDAWAGAALAATFLAADAQSEAELGYQALQREVAVAQVRVGFGRPGDTADSQEGSEQTDTPEELHAAATRRDQQTLSLASLSRMASDKQRQAVSSLRHAAAMLVHGEQLTTLTPLMSTAVALWYASDAADVQSRALVAPQLAAAEQLADGSLVPESDAGKVPNLSAAAGFAVDPHAAWRALARAQCLAATPKAPEAAVVAAYEAALTLQPSLRRARWELAAYQVKRGTMAQARAQLADLAHSRPPHGKALALLGTLPKPDGAAPFDALPAHLLRAAAQHEQADFNKANPLEPRTNEPLTKEPQ